MSKQQQTIKQKRKREKPRQLCSTLLLTTANNSIRFKFKHINSVLQTMKFVEVLSFLHSNTFHSNKQTRKGENFVYFLKTRFHKLFSF